MKAKLSAAIFWLAVLAGTFSYAQAPVIHYSSPQVYTVGMPISPLTPVNTGGAIPDLTPVTLGTGFFNPNGVAVDAAGNIYVAESGKNAIDKIPAGGGAPVAVGSGFSNPTGVAVDAAGNVYVADQGNNAVKKILTDGTIVSIGSGFNKPNGIAVDAAGNVYVSNTISNAVNEIPAGGGATIVKGSGFKSPAGVAVDAAGNIYVADQGNNAIKKIPAGGGSVISLAAGGGSPNGVMVNTAGDVYFSDTNQFAIIMIPAAGGSLVSIGSGFNKPSAVATDAAGNIYLAETVNSGGIVQKINFGGYTITPCLPQGLRFDNNLGVISGTPASASAATDYTVTAYNSSGRSTATINITNNLPPAPVISYSSPQVYPVGSAIAPLAPSSTGGAVPAMVQSTLFTAFIDGLAADAAGNVYFLLGSYVAKIPVGSATPIVIGFGVTGYEAITVDGAGNVYAYTDDASAISMIAPNGATHNLAGGGGLTGTVSGITADGAGNVYVFNNGRIKKIPAGGGTPVSVGPTFSDNVHIAADAAGNIYAATASAITKVAPDGTATHLATVHGGRGIAADAAGNVYFTDVTHNITKIPAGGSPVVVTSGFLGSGAIAVDGAGNLFGSGINEGSIQEIYYGGYYVNHSLPQGLALDAGTGVISGAPAVTSPAAYNVVTANNVSGSSSATIKITANLPPPPAISYSSPVAYTVDQTISPLSPVNTGGAVPPPTPVSFTAGFTQPASVGLDDAGDIFVLSNDSLKKIPAGGGASVYITNAVPNEIAVTHSGDVYVGGGLSITKYLSTGGSQLIYSNSTGHITSIAVDGLGSIYFVITRFHNTPVLKKLRAGTTAPFEISTSFTTPLALTTDNTGYLYVVGNGTSITKLDTAGGYIMDLALNLTNVNGIASTAAGDVYFTNGSGNLYEVPANSTTTVTAATGFNSLSGVAVDIKGDIAVADHGANAVKLFYFGGYVVSPVLPAGLNLDKATGVISGTPLLAGAAANYTVTAYNQGGNGSATINIAVNLPAKPHVSYSSPHVYPVDKPITPLSPTKSGGAVPSQDPLTLGTGMFASSGLAVDTKGSVYVVAANSILYKIPAGGGIPLVIRGFIAPKAIAVDAAGNLYAVNGQATIQELPANGGPAIKFASSSASFSYIAVDAAGNMYASDTFNNSIKKIPAGGGAAVTLASGFNNPAGLTVDASGNVFVADKGNNEIKKIPAGGGTPVVLTQGNGSPDDVAVDGFGNIYFSDTNNSTITLVTPAGGIFPIGSGFKNPAAVDVDATGNIYIADSGNAAVEMIYPGGYFVTPALPAGLTVFKNTGTISGTPTVSTPAANYKIFTRNAAGNSAISTVNITIDAGDAGLSGLAISAGMLAPVFSTNNAVYTAAEKHSTASVTITPTTTSGTATVKVNGVTVASGSPSAAIPLNVGDNLITTTVTAADGSANTYSITATRAPTPNSNLSALSLSTGTLSPAFAPATNSYAATVPNATAAIRVKATAADSLATVQVNGVNVTPGKASQAINLTVGSNMITVNVIDRDGVNANSYEITVTRQGTADATLSALALSAGTVSPAFARGHTSYTAAEANSVTSITVTPTATDPSATITVNGTTVASGTASPAISLPVGSTGISIAVTGNDGITIKTYSLTVNRAPSANANLSALRLNAGSLSPAFDPGTTSYSQTVPNSSSNVRVLPTAQDPTATIQVNGMTVASGSNNAVVALSVGSNTITTVVTAQDGTTTKTYTITVTRQASPIAGSLDEIAVEKPAQGPQVETDGITVHRGISPNGDGVGDRLIIDGITSYPDNKLTIMDRSGQLVFEEKGYDNAARFFDGHSNKTGAKQLPGTYFYSLEYTVKGVAKHKTGFIVLKY